MNYILNIELAMIFVGLILTSFAYHILSSLKFWLDSSKEFCWKCTFKGVLQGAVVGVSIAITYAAAQFVPDISVANIGGDQVDLMMALKLVITMAYVAYAYKAIKAIAAVFGLSVKKVKPIEYEEQDEQEVRPNDNAKG